MDWPVIFKEIIEGAARIAVLITAIIVPLMVLLALLTDSRMLDRTVGFIQPIMKRLNLSTKAAFPLLAGLFFGIVFGSGVIISFANDGSLTRRDLILVLVFLCVCHSVIEDTLIFTALGANWWILILCRILLASLAAFTASFIIPSKLEPIKNTEEL